MSTTDNTTMTNNSTMTDNSIIAVIALNVTIQRSIDTGLMTEENANELRDMINRVRINTELLNAIINFNESYLVLHDCLSSSASATSSADAENPNV